MEIKELLKKLWGIELLKLNYNQEFICDSEMAAILLACNSENFARFSVLEKFKEIFKLCDFELNKYNLQNAQAGIILAIKHLKIRRSEIIYNLNELKKNEILKSEFYKIISDFLLSFNFDEISFENAANTAFHKNLYALNTIAENLKFFCDEILKNRLENAINSANNANFKIAISGVINAGKSSLINALVGQDLLGVSNVPQTASICVLKYAQNPCAKIEFLASNEQGDLPKKELENKDVDFSDLMQFSSANSELAKYVKCCVLGINSDILKGIEIIDTPGIDDAIKVREELSAKYLKNCDCVLYLMNSAQACTKKDMDFLKNILKNTKNSEILVLLTHIDKLNANEQESVLEYTQKSILAELEDINEELAKNIKYFMLSATKNIGINELKAYITESFFGSFRSKIILTAYKKEIKLILSELLGEYEQKLRAFNSQSNNLNNEIIALKEQEIKEAENLEKASAKIAEISSQISNEKINLDNDIAMISSKIATRVINELKYRQNKKEKVSSSQLFTIANGAFKDFLIDLLREKKQGLEQKLQSFALILNELLAGFNFKMPDFKSYLDKINFNPDFTAFKAHLDLDSDLQKANTKLTENLKVFLLNLNLNEQISQLFLTFSKEFNDNLTLKFSELKNESQARNSRLLKALNDANNGDLELSKEIEKCLENLKNLKELKESLETC